MGKAYLLQCGDVISLDDKCINQLVCVGKGRYEKNEEGHPVKIPWWKFWKKGYAIYQFEYMMKGTSNEKE